MKLNNRGFTLVEMLAVVALLGLLIGIATPNIMKSQKKAKERLLSSKVKNIEKAAVLWGQDNKDQLTRTKKTSLSKCGGVGYDCAIIKVNTLVTGNDPGNTSTNPDEEVSTYLNYDEGTMVKNPVSELDMKDCKIYVYKKYNKVHAVYDKSTNSNDSEKCWVKK